VDERDGHVWLGPPPADGAFGRHGRPSGSAWTEQAPDIPAQRLGSVRHVFTHFTLNLHIVARLPSRSAKAGGSRSTRMLTPGFRRSIGRAAEQALAASQSQREAA
jgi:hypothetical protein